jgi:uncharacterized protein (TIRG00374 family)
MTFRRIMQWAGLIAMALLIFLSRGRIGQVIHLLHNVRWYILILIVAVQLFSYWCNAKYYQSFFRIFDINVEMSKILPRALALNFVNQAFPSGGIVGTSYLSTSLKDEVPVGKSTLAQLMRYIFTFGSFLVVLGLGFLLLFLTGHLDQASVRVIMLFILAIIVASLIFVVLMADRARVYQLGRAIVNSINNLAMNWFRRKKVLITDQQRLHFFDEFYHGYEVLGEQKGHWRHPFLFSLGGNLAEVLTVYIVFLAFGHVINPGIVVAAYTLANIISLASPITGGAGVYEATMIGTLVALGVPFDVSFTGVLVYRVLNALIFLPVGFYYYRKTI